MLHRVVIRKFDPVVGRRVYENTPWQPDKEQVLRFLSSMRGRAGVVSAIVESIPFEVSAVVSKVSRTAAPTVTASTDSKGSRFIAKAEALKMDMLLDSICL